jgi:CBS domain-containing protein
VHQVNENIGALPVCQDTRVIGMLTDRDITVRGVADARNVSQMTVREAMSAEDSSALLLRG